MTALRKCRKPANDGRPPSARRLAYVALPRPSWDARRAGALAVLTVFTLCLAALLAVKLSALRPVADTALVPATVKSAPYDIVLNAAQTEPESVASLARKLPQDVIAPARRKPRASFHIDIESDPAAAARQAEIPENLALDLRDQRQALEKDPGNWAYRYALAVLYDRAGDKAGAATLYRQVLQAMGRGAANLPVDIKTVEARADYLDSSPE